jgi:hypothetical protein
MESMALEDDLLCCDFLFAGALEHWYLMYTARFIFIISA